MKHIRKRFVSIILACVLLLGVLPADAFASGQSADSLTLQPGETASSVNLNWYAPEGTTSAVVKFGTEVFSADISALTTPTEVKESKYTDTGKVVCKATVTGLAADTEYSYQISNDGGQTWSKKYTYKTPAADSFTFAFTSDPQIKEDQSIDDKGWNPFDGTNQTGWQQMMEKIAESGATLIVSAGDQVEDQSWGKSSEYEAFFAPEEMAQIAYAPAVGNHDRHYMFADHFNLPNEMSVSGTESDDADVLTEVKTTFRGQNSGTSQSHGNYIQATESEIANQSASNGVMPNEEGMYDFEERREMETRGNYYYLYNNALFVTLNTGAYPGGNDAENGLTDDNSEAEAIVANFRKTLTSAVTKYAGQYDWIFVTHHKSTQTVAKHTADSDIENYVDAGFEALMDEFDVDFVLAGHDHVYSRSYVLKDGVRNSERLDTINDPDGTIYVTGNCCSDMQYYTPFASLDKTNNADYPVLANGETGSLAYLKGAEAENPADYLPYGNQEYNQEYSPSYAVFQVTGDTVSVTVYNLDGDSKEPENKEIDAFTVTKSLDGGEKTTGYENGSSSLSMTQSGRFESGMTNADGGVMEIVDYNAATGWAYAVNGQSGKLTAIALKDMEAGDRVDLLDGNDIDIRTLVTDDGFVYGDMTSVAVSPDGALLAAAIQAENYAENGRVALFACNMDGTLTFLQAIPTGVQPDMVTFTPDGTRILTANEGEPREGYGGGATDPAGSVTIVNVSDASAVTVGFEAFDGSREQLTDAGIVLKKDTAPSVDLEPEYIACSDTAAYVSLQEANAVAVLDLNTKAFTGIYSAGFEDYSQTAVDIDSGDGIYAPKTYENVKGIRMPDGIAFVTINGADYLLTANEGDSRSWNDYSNERKSKKSPSGAVSVDKKVTWFDAEDYDGLEAGTDYLFGGRSFTMFAVTENGLEEVYTSGSGFEEKTAAYLPQYFNCSNDDLSAEDRSGKKGPEPETVVTGSMDGRVYAFITLERIGGVMVYDITNPNEVSYVNYINSRDFSDTLGKDDSPEGLKFISAEQSPTGQALLLAACEVGGTVAVYDLVSGEKKPSEGETDPPSTEEDPENPSEEDGNRPDEEETTKQPSEAETAEPEETEKNPEQNPNTGGIAPNTGDEQNVGIWIVWMGLAGAGMVIGSRKKHRRA